MGSGDQINTSSISGSPADIYPDHVVSGDLLLVPLQPIFTTNSPVCEGDDLFLFATIPPPPTYNYRWIGPNNQVVNNPFFQIPSADMSFNGTYTLEVLDLNIPPNTVATYTYNITVVPLPVIQSLARYEVCENDVFIFQDNIMNPGTITWTSAGNGSFLEPNSAASGYQPGYTDIANGMVTLTLTVESMEGGMCASATEQISLVVLEAPELQFVITKESDCDDQNGAITIFMPGPVADYTYSLDGISFYANNHFSGLSAATYNIMAADVNGCRAFYPENPFVLAQMEECNEEFVMPNAFVPLSSNIVNNTFYPIWVNSIPSEYSMLIYNKWGELVFETRNPYAGWDGKSNNELLPAETYAYVVRVKFIHDAGTGFKEQRGSVRLVR